MNINIRTNNQIHNHYKLELVDILTGLTKQVVECHNTVLNTWLNGIGRGVASFPGGVALGTGTTAPSPIDTALANKLWDGILTSNTLATTYPTAKRTVKITVPADAAIGALTEIGLCWMESWLGSYRYTGLATRALLADSEGNPIVINKSATDILNITIVINYTFSMPEGVGEGTDYFLCRDETNALFRLLINGTRLAFPVYFNPYLVNSYDSALTRQSQFCLTGSEGTIGTCADGVFLSGGVSLLYSVDTQWSNGLGYDVKSIGITYLGVFNITEDIFPPTPFPKYQVGVGDGANKAFDIKTPSCKENTQKVYVDGVLKTEGVDYTFYPYNNKDFHTNAISADVAYATYGLDSYYGFRGTPFYPMEGITVRVSTTTPVLYDFKEPVTLNFAKFNTAAGSFADGNVVLQYSIDGTNWATALTPTAAMKGAGPQLFEAVTARYWRWYGSGLGGYQEYSATKLMWLALFGYYVPSISFVNPPPLNAIVEIEYDIKYPFKNSYHSIATTFSIDFQVGGM